MKKGTIILLNGVSSSGKTTLAKEFVKQMPDYFALSIDDFDYIIEKMEDRKLGHLIPIATERYFHQTVAMFSDSGVNLVVDQVWHDVSTMEDCMAVLRDYPVLFVGVHCPIAALEEREKTRGDRRIGQAEAQLVFVHQQQENYDLEVNTFENSIDDCVQSIRNGLLNREETGGWVHSFNQTRQAADDV